MLARYLSIIKMDPSVCCIIFVVSSTVAAERLRRKKIICINLNRIIMAGKVKVVCFDKTGTLTKNGLNFAGCHEIFYGSLTSVYHRFDWLNENIQLGMLTCHNLSTLNNEFVGNFVDVEMFNATSGKLDPNDPSLVYSSSLVDESILIHRVHPFNPHLGYMSVLVEKDGRLCMFLKGSFESLIQLADPDSVPSNAKEVTEEHSGLGCYCIGLAMKDLEGYSLEQVMKMDRVDLEFNPNLIGILLFRNDLKPDTTLELSRLKLSGVKQVMITGDHVATAIFIGNASGILDTQGTLNPFTFIAEYDEASEKVTWKEFYSNAYWPISRIEAACRLSQKTRKVFLCIGGSALPFLEQSGWLRDHLDYCFIFARMNPIQKITVVKLYMKNNVTMMVGDGGNDSGALKTAHVGLAFSSQAESSVVSHFSSNGTSLSSVIDLLQEGRCSLDVALACYKMLILYGQVLMINGLVQMYFMVQQSQGMWIVIDGSSFIISFCLLCARPAEILIPKSPTARLLGTKTLISALGQILINLIFCSFSMWALLIQPFYIQQAHDYHGSDLKKWWELSDNYEASLTAILSGYQIMACAASFNIGNNFRRGFWSNYQFLIAFFLGFGFLSFLLLANPNFIGCTLRVNCGSPSALVELGYQIPWRAPKLFYNPQLHNVFPLYFRFAIFGIVMANLLALILYELFL
jgi:magnesium-transporting ATPase (P-type)